MIIFSKFVKYKIYIKKRLKITILILGKIAVDIERDLLPVFFLCIFPMIWKDVPLYNQLMVVLPKIFFAQVFLSLCYLTVPENVSVMV